MRRVKKDPMASAQRWWTLMSRAVVSHLDHMNCPCRTADRSSEMSQSLRFGSWILRHHIHPGSRRQTLGQSTADKDRSGSFFPIINNRLSIRKNSRMFRSSLQGSCSTLTSATSWAATRSHCLHPWSWARRWWRGWGACRVSSTRSSGNSATLLSCTSGGQRCAG